MTDQIQTWENEGGTTVEPKVRCFFCHREQAHGAGPVIKRPTRFGFSAMMCMGCRGVYELDSQVPAENLPEPQIVEAIENEEEQPPTKDSEALKVLASIFNRTRPVFENAPLEALSDRIFYLENVIKSIRQEIYVLEDVKKERLKKAFRAERDKLSDHESKRKATDNVRVRREKRSKADKAVIRADAEAKYVTQKARDIYITLKGLGGLLTDEQIDAKIKGLGLN